MGLVECGVQGEGEGERGDVRGVIYDLKLAGAQPYAWLGCHLCLSASACACACALASARARAQPGKPITPKALSIQHILALIPQNTQPLSHVSHQGPLRRRHHLLPPQQTDRCQVRQPNLRLPGRSCIHSLFLTQPDCLSSGRSDLRQVPDTQEVFLSPDSDLSLIVEVLELVTEEGAGESVEKALK